MDISIVIPCYRSGDNIRRVVDHIDEVLVKEHLTYEIIMVNDGSPDNTFEIIDDIASGRANTLALDLARNIGQHAALMAGFHYAKGEYIITCEDDGQSDAAYIPQMLEKLKEGYDVAALTFSERGKRSLFRRFGTFVEESTSTWMIPRPKGIYVPIFFAAKRFVIEEVIKYDQPFPYLEGLILRSTYHIALVEGDEKERMEGSSGYNLSKLFRLWLDGFTSFSIKPLRVSTFLGFAFAAIGFLMGIYVIVRKLLFNNTLLGWSSTVSIMLIMFGITLTMLGLIGEYVGRVYLCINKTPQFLVRRVTRGPLENSNSNEDIILNLSTLKNSKSLLEAFCQEVGQPVPEKLTCPIAMVHCGVVAGFMDLDCSWPKARVNVSTFLPEYRKQGAEKAVLRYAEAYVHLCGCSSLAFPESVVGENV